MTNRNPSAISRLRQDFLHLKKHPFPNITAEPSPGNILKWHYVIKGPEDSAYKGGYYHGVLSFPLEFPFKPPTIYMLTPNGRFKTGIRLCLSISDDHPEYWTPVWSVGTILTGLLSFMMENTPTLGSIETENFEKQNYAKKSLKFNLSNSKFRELFPEISEDIIRRLKELGDDELIQDENGCKRRHEETAGCLKTEKPFHSDVVELKQDSKSGKKISWFEGEICELKTVYSYLATIIGFVVFLLIVNHTVVGTWYE